MSSREHTDRCGLVLFGFVPRAGLAHVVLGLEHQRAGGADLDAVAAVDARRLLQGNVEFGADMGIESATCHGDGERVLPLLATGIDALVAEDAARVVAHVQVVVDLDRLLHGLGVPEPGRLGAVFVQPGVDKRRCRQIDRRAE